MKKIEQMREKKANCKRKITFKYYDCGNKRLDLKTLFSLKKKKASNLKIKDLTLLYMICISC